MTEALAIAEFWNTFRRQAPKLARAVLAQDPSYQALLRDLQAIDDGLFLEFSTTDVPHELIVTADGDRELFPIVRRIVAAAPVVDGWVFLALKPKLGFPVSTVWEDFTLEIRNVLFEPLVRTGSDQVGLRIFVRHLDEQEADDAHNAVLRAMDHGLGEERLANSVAHTEVLTLPPETDTGNLIPLVELERFLDWRDSQRK
jgi:hypothetical protein